MEFLQKNKHKVEKHLGEVRVDPEDSRFALIEIIVSPLDTAKDSVVEYIRVHRGSRIPGRPKPKPRIIE